MEIDMETDIKTSNRFTDTPRDKLRAERVEHGNLDRPGAQAHPRASGWERQPTPWRLH